VKTAGNAPDGEEFVTVPGPVTYHYHVTNTGPVTLSNIVVTDDNGTPGDTSDDFTATCPQTTLAPGASMDCSATVQVTADRTNVAVAEGTSPKGNHVEDDDDAVVRVPGVNIDKSADDHDVEQNQTVHYTIDVTVTDGPVHNATVTDNLPDGQTYVAGSGKVDGSASEPTISNGGKTLTWDLGTLNDGDPAATITYDVTIDGDASTDPQTNEAKLCVGLSEEGRTTSATRTRRRSRRRSRPSRSSRRPATPRTARSSRPSPVRSPTPTRSPTPVRCPPRRDRHG
jgi:fimbrial isopeptide formation D2 family protein